MAKYIEKDVLQVLLTKIVSRNDARYLMKGAEAVSAAKVKNALTINGEAFDGSEAKLFSLATSDHKHSSTDITDFKAAVEKVISDAGGTSHAHTNKAALDLITEGKIAAWEGKIDVDDVAKLKYSNTGMTSVSDVKGALDVLVANVQIAAGQLDMASKNMDAVKKIADDAAKAAADEKTRAEKAEGALQTRIDDLLNAEKEGSLAKQVASNKAAIDQEVLDRTAADTTLQGNIDAEVTRAKAAEGANATAIANEVTAREQADTTLDDKITTEKERAEAAEQGLRTDVNANKAAIDTLKGGEKVVGSVANAVAVEKTRAMGVEGGLRTDVNKAQGDVDALAGKVGTVPDDKTVVQMIEEAKTEATYDDTQVKADIAKNASDISVIKADYLKAADKTALEGQISTAQKAADDAQAAANKAQGDIDAFMAAADIGGDAIDTLKEIQVYITSDGAAADQMVKDITKNAEDIAANKKAIDAINNTETGILKSAKDYADEQDEALHGTITGEIATAKSEAITAAGNDATSKVNAAKTKLQDKIDLKADASALQDEITRATGVEGGLQTAINTLNAGSTTQGSVDYKIAQAKSTIDAAIDGVKGRLDTAEGEIDTLQATVAKLDGDVNTDGSVKKQIKDAVDPVAGRVTTAEGEIDALQTAVGDARSGLVKDVAGLKGTVGSATSGLVKDVADLKTKTGTHDTDITNLKAKDKSLESSINDNAANIAANTGDITELKSTVGNHATSITKLQQWQDSHGDILESELDAMLDTAYGVTGQ